MRTVYGDHDRFIETYFSQYDGYYFTAAGGYEGTLRAFQLIQEEIIRDMKLMGCNSFKDLNKDNLRFR